MISLFSAAGFDRSMIVEALGAGRLSPPLWTDMPRRRPLALLRAGLSLHSSLRVLWFFGILWCELGAYRYAVWICGWPDNRLKTVSPALTFSSFHRDEADPGLPVFSRRAHPCPAHHRPPSPTFCGPQTATLLAGPPRLVLSCGSQKELEIRKQSATRRRHFPGRYAGVGSQNQGRRRVRLCVRVHCRR